MLSVDGRASGRSSAAVFVVSRLLWGCAYFVCIFFSGAVVSSYNVPKCAEES